MGYEHELLYSCSYLEVSGRVKSVWNGKYSDPLSFIYDLRQIKAAVKSRI